MKKLTRHIEMTNTYFILNYAKITKDVAHAKTFKLVGFQIFWL